jgi:hypothetical protein
MSTDEAPSTPRFSGNSRIKATPPPIITKKKVPQGTKHMMRLMEAWAWLRKFPFSRSVQYVRIHPERLPCYEDLPVLSVILSEHPGLYVVSNLDYFKLYCKLDTEERRPDPLEYYYALDFFKRHHAASDDITDFGYSSDSDY